jgi:hypothetical protein
MPDPFWMEVEKAYNAVSANTSLIVSIERGDKTGTVKYSPEMGVIYIKIEAAKDTISLTEMNPAAMKEVD